MMPPPFITEGGLVHSPSEAFSKDAICLNNNCEDDPFSTISEFEGNEAVIEEITA